MIVMGPARRNINDKYSHTQSCWMRSGSSKHKKQNGPAMQARFLWEGKK
jgi:hypothetical protein